MIKWHPDGLNLDIPAAYAINITKKPNPQSTTQVNEIMKYKLLPIIKTEMSNKN